MGHFQVQLSLLLVPPSPILLRWTCWLQRGREYDRLCQSRPATPWASKVGQSLHFCWHQGRMVPHSPCLPETGRGYINFTNPTQHTVTYLPYSIHLGKKIMSKVIQKSEVLNMRCTNVREYCKYYLKYWPQGINGPLDPRGGQNFWCFIKWKCLRQL